MTHSVDQLAQSIIDAHEGGPVIDTVPEALVPQGPAGIHALQDAIMARLGPAGGWKIAASAGPGAICAPIPASRYFAAASIFNGRQSRFVIAEVEVALRLATDLPAGAGKQATEAAVGSVHAALEFIASPFRDRNAMPVNLLHGALQSNGAVVLGPPLEPGLRAELATLEAALAFDGKPVHIVNNGASWDQTLDTLAWLAGHAAERGQPLRAGQVIITGARAVAPLGNAGMIDGRLGVWGRVACSV